MKDLFIHESAIVEEGAQLGEGTKVWHFSHIMPDVQIGDFCNIGQNVFMAKGVTIGTNVKIQNNVSLYTGVTCEDDVFLGPSMVFTNVINPRSGVNRKQEYMRTIVKKGASIGANATIVCGNNIGQYAFIAAGAVVTKEVPDHALIIGNPGRIVGWMSEYGERLEFDSQNVASCPTTSTVYMLINGLLKKQ
jgi:UDP-2-acetamido-3-amino-2,3-dideoxy-glucuronate N-acetyltransferase